MRVRVGAFRAVFVVFVIAPIIGGAAAAPGRAAPSGPHQAAIQYQPDGQECAFLHRINRYRKKHGKRPLRLSATLGAAAEHHGQDMARTDVLGHTLSDGTSALQNIRDFGYRGRSWGENVLWGRETAAGAFRWWQHSPEHDRNMLNAGFRAIGIGRAYAAGSDFGWYWTTTFGGATTATIGC